MHLLLKWKDELQTCETSPRRRTWTDDCRQTRVVLSINWLSFPSDWTASEAKTTRGQPASEACSMQVTPSDTPTIIPTLCRVSLGDPSAWEGVSHFRSGLSISSVRSPRNIEPSQTAAVTR